MQVLDIHERSSYKHDSLIQKQAHVALRFFCLQSDGEKVVEIQQRHIRIYILDEAAYELSAQGQRWKK